ncbi:hypothetical protein A2555_01625 [Candidatus Falkowbacteria bacterium RIFOXYD2_FULL_39_16]|nr:MAG: hypothetical protein A2555_01625 [Candidatus Falkowbacteria bacterium RIFOXYD2_FULL_39_16]
MTKFKLNLMMVAVSLFAFLSMPALTEAHSVVTATWHSVSHGHYGFCGPNGCPTADATFERSYSFLSRDRVFSGTGAWNCHGRTFDLRRSWISLAEPYINYDRPYSPSSPRSGDAIIFWQSGQTSHSITMLSSWSGLDTQVMSKYGTQGQYRHRLRDVARVYGGDWAITRFAAGTRIYTSLRDGQFTNQPFSNYFILASSSLLSPGEKLREQRKTMPWYKDVLESQKIYGEEHPKFVKKITGLNSNRVKQLEDTTDVSKEILILLEDLKDLKHYELLGVYNSPAFSAEFIEEIEAGKKLVEIAKKYSSEKKYIAESLYEIIEKSDHYNEDRLRGAAVYFLTQILSEKDIAKLKEKMGQEIKREQKDIDMPSYVEFYLDKAVEEKAASA